MASRREKAAPFLVAAAAFIAFLPALRAGFTNWDDDYSIVLNPHIRGFTLENLRWMFFPGSTVNYIPLYWLSLAGTYAAAGPNPFVFHLKSLFIHAANAALFYFIARRLFAGGAAAAVFAALLFAVHPLRAETAVWASNRADALAAFFFLSTVLLYLRGRRPWALAAYAASLLSKDSGMVLPGVLLVLDFSFFKRRVKDRAVWVEKLPFAALACAAAFASLYCHWHSGALWPAGKLSLGARFAQAFYGLAFYPRKTLLPFGLLPLYMTPARISLFDPPFFWSAAAVLSFSAWVVIGAKRRGTLAAASAYYVVTLLPVLGLLKSGPQLVADRYSYLSCLGWALLAGDWLSKSKWRSAAGSFVILALGALSWRQALVWRDSESLWSWTAEQDPSHSIARNYLGNIRFEQGRLQEAAVFYREALRIDPVYASADNNLGNVLARSGKPEEAAAAYREAIRLSPGHAVVHRNLGLVLAGLGRKREAVEEFQEELRLNPGDREAARALDALK